MLVQGQVGQITGLDGAQPNARQGRTGELIISQAHGRFYEQASRGKVFSLTLTATSADNVGNAVGAAAAASTNFALWNPLGSGFNLSILKAYVAAVSGTPTGGPVFHGYITNSIPTIASTGTAYNNLAGGPPPVARYVASAAGTALTGASAVVTGRAMNIDFSASSFASAAGSNCLDLVDGDIVIPPGYGWVPLWAGTGTTLRAAYSVTWEEVPI
jgi:hypothetical protein